MYAMYQQHKSSKILRLFLLSVKHKNFSFLKLDQFFDLVHNILANNCANTPWRRGWESAVNLNSVSIKHSIFWKRNVIPKIHSNPSLALMPRLRLLIIPTAFCINVKSFISQLLSRNPVLWRDDHNNENLQTKQILCLSQEVSLQCSASHSWTFCCVSSGNPFKR